MLDRAIQVHGGGGVSQDFPLARTYAHLRTLRLADGPDEVHKMTRWMITFAGFPLGGVAAMVTVGHVDSTGAAILGGIATGAVLGAVQAWALRADRRFLGAWIAATAVGLATGLAIGASLATVAFMTGQWLLLPIVGVVFMAETFSVMIQVAYFKWTGGKRIFRMTPLHHHFELIGALPQACAFIA